MEPDLLPPAAVSPARPRRQEVLASLAAVGRSLLFLVAFFLVSGLARVLVALGARAANFPAITRALDLRAEILLLVYAVTALLLFPVTVLLLRFLDRRRFADLGFRWPDGGRARALRQAVVVPLATLGVLALWLAVMATAADLRIHGFSPEWRHGVAGWPIPPPLLLGLLLAGFLVQGGVEEWLVRGYIFRNLRDRWSFPVAGLASSSLFAALHLANPSATAVSTFNTLLAGFLLAEMVERSGSLWSAVLCHGVWNFAIGCLISLPVSGIAIFKLLDVELQGPAPLTGGGYGPEASAVLTAIAVPLAVFLWPRRRRGSAAPAADREVEEVRPGVVAGDVQGEVAGVDPGEVQVGHE